MENVTYGQGMNAGRSSVTKTGVTSVLQYFSEVTPKLLYKKCS